MCLCPDPKLACCSSFNIQYDSVIDTITSYSELFLVCHLRFNDNICALMTILKSICLRQLQPSTAMSQLHFETTSFGSFFLCFFI